MINESDFEFLQVVWSRRPVFTYIFFGFNIALFILMTLAGGTTNDLTLLAFGVKANDLINQGEVWRFVTPIFIHIGLLHLFFNSYALWMVGPQVEKLYGGARFVLLYVLTGVCGVLGSYVYRPEANSAGASGAIFGLFGVLLVFGVRYRRQIPAFFSRAVGTSVLPVIVINLIIGFTIPQIDNSAHIAGLIGGMALAAIVPFERPRTRTPMFFTGVQIALFAIIVASFFQVATHYQGPRIAFQNVYRNRGNLFGVSSSADEFINTINEAQRTFASSYAVLEPGHEAEIPKASAELGGTIDKLKKIPSLDAKVDGLSAKMRALLEDQYSLLQDVERTGTVTLMHNRRATENEKIFRELLDSFSEWVSSDGKRYGIQLPKPH